MAGSGATVASDRRNSRVAVISLLAMISVLWQHCSCGSRGEQWFLPLMAVWAVPWFFAVSGFFFEESLIRHGVINVLKRKVSSLVIPYFIWCIFGVLLCLIVGGGDSMSIVDIFALRPECKYPRYNTALWYVRSLILFEVVGAVLIVFLNRIRKYKLVLFAGLFFGVVFILDSFLVEMGNYSSYFYFVFGVLLGGLRAYKDGWYHLDKRVLEIVGLVLIVAAFGVRFWWFHLGYSFKVMGGNLWANISVFLFISGLWLVMASLAERLYSIALIRWCCGLTAIVYYMHYPIISMIKSKCSMLFSPDAIFWGLAVGYPCFNLFLAGLIKKFVPKTYGVLSGGR